jgi:hypothetical protein
VYYYKEAVHCVKGDSMPTKGFSIRMNNYKYLETISAEKGVSPSEYLNMLLEDAQEIKVEKAPPVLKSKSDIIFSDNLEEVTTGKGTVSERTRVVSRKGDGLHTCKTCGSMLTMYKGKCKVCGR